MPRVLLAYTVVSHGKRTAEFLERFRLTYDDFPAGYPADVVCVCNGGPPAVEEAVWMRSEWKCLPRKNDPGWDLSGYCDVAHKLDCDILCAFGESVYFWKEGWLKRLVECWEKDGPGLYGFFSNNNTTPHLVTTAFVVDPKLLRGVPVPRTKKERYDFEHSPIDSFWRRVQKLGKPVRFVTWDGCWKPEEWRVPNRIMWKEDQSNLLLKCIHTQRFDDASTHTRKVWSENANTPFNGC